MIQIDFSHFVFLTLMQLSQTGVGDKFNALLTSPGALAVKWDWIVWKWKIGKNRIYSKMIIWCMYQSNWECYVIGLLDIPILILRVYHGFKSNILTMY